MKPTVENATRLFLKLYDEAKDKPCIHKPISYALYLTWKEFDSIEREEDFDE